MADFLANKAMDTRSSWRWCAPNAEHLVAKADGIICFSDGGFRPGPELAAAGWVVVVIYPEESANNKRMLHVISRTNSK